MVEASPVLGQRGGFSYLEGEFTRPVLETLTCQLTDATYRPAVYDMPNKMASGLFRPPTRGSMVGTPVAASSLTRSPHRLGSATIGTTGLPRDEVTDVEEIICVRCGQRAPKLARPPISGPLGEAVWEQVCVNCWGEWRAQSVLIVNHYGLQPADPNDRAQLYEFMKEFLTLQV
jgi:Fe-S cluster biosynthesis and repair protein YggX